MADNNLNRYGHTQFRAQAIPTVGATRYAQDQTKGNPARGRLSGIAMTSGHPSDERSKRMQERADAAEGSSTERRVATEQEAQMRQNQMGRILEDAQMSRGEHPQQVQARMAADQLSKQREQDSTLHRMRQMAEIGHMVGDAKLDQNGFRVLPADAAGKIAAITGLSNLAITNEGEKAPQLAVKLVGNPGDPNSAQMQFFVGGKEGFKPLTTGDGAPVAPRLNVTNQMMSLVDRLDYDTARGSSLPAGTKGNVDLQKEGMGNQSENARARLSAAQKVLDSVLTNDPDNAEMKKAALSDYTNALQGVSGAGTTYAGQPNDGTFKPLFLQPDFDLEGNPFGKSKGTATAAGPAAGPAPATGAAPAPMPGQAQAGGLPTGAPMGDGKLGAPWDASADRMQVWGMNARDPSYSVGPQPGYSGPQAEALARQNLEVTRDPRQYALDVERFRPSPGAIDAENARRAHAAMLGGQTQGMLAADLEDQRQVEGIQSGWPNASAVWDYLSGRTSGDRREAERSAFEQAQRQLGY